MTEYVFRLVGRVCADASAVVITDPRYLESTDAEALRKAVSEAANGGAGEFEIPRGEGEKGFCIQGVASSTGIGDGVYPVYACIVPDPLLPDRNSVERLFVDFTQRGENPFPELIITMRTPIEKKANEPMILERVVIDRIRKDGLVLASDYSECDHSTDSLRKVMFRPKSALIEWDERLLDGQYDSSGRKYGDIPPVLKEGYGICIEYGYEEKDFLHKIRRIIIVYRKPEIDWLLEL